MRIATPPYLQNCMRFSSLVVKNLTRRPLRSALTLLAFATAICAVVSLLGIAKGFTRSFAGVYETHSVDIVVSRQGTADRLSSSVDQDFVDKIAAIPGIVRTAGVLLDTMSLEEREVYGIPAVGIAEDSWMLDDYRIESVSGAQSGFAGDPEDSRRLMMGIHLAERIGAKPGDTVMMFEEPFTVTGIVESRSTWENGSMFIPLAALQKLTDRAGQVTYINVVLEDSANAADAASAVAQIKEQDARLHPLTTAEFVATDTRMQIAAAMAWMTSFIALVIGAIGILNTMMTSVLERTDEIGILRAIGWPRGRVAKMIVLESVLLALLASVIGILLAVLLTWGLSQSSAARGILSPSIDPQVILQGIVLALGIGVLGAMIPAWRAARMMPTEAFRSV